MIGTAPKPLDDGEAWHGCRKSEVAGQTAAPGAGRRPAPLQGLAMKVWEAGIIRSINPSIIVKNY